MAGGRAVDAVRQAAAGLGHAHAAGLIHRDVKPGNLLLDRMGTVKVVDLGLARYRDAAQNAGLTGMYDSNRVIGTADFQAPEQGLDSGNADARSDVYGLGAALYYLLTGRVPYPEGTITNKLLAHQMKPVPERGRGEPGGAGGPGGGGDADDGEAAGRPPADDGRRAGGARPAGSRPNSTRRRRRRCPNTRRRRTGWGCARRRPA